MVRWCFFLFLFLVSLVGVGAAQVQLTTQPSNLFVSYPKIDTFVVGVPVDLYFHVYSPEGVRLENSTVNCTFHLYNSTGQHVIKQNLPFDGYEWEVSLNASIMSRRGRHTYLVDCHNTTAGGFVSNYFTVSGDGSEAENNRDVGALWVVVLIPLLFGLVLIGGAGLFDPEEHQALRVFLFLIACLMPVVSIGFAVVIITKFLTWEGLASSLGFTGKALGWGVVVAVILYWLIYLIYTTFREQKMKREY